MNDINSKYYLTKVFLARKSRAILHVCEICTEQSNTIRKEDKEEKNRKRRISDLFSRKKRSKGCSGLCACQLNAFANRRFYDKQIKGKKRDSYVKNQRKQAVGITTLKQRTQVRNFRTVCTEILWKTNRSRYRLLYYNRFYLFHEIFVDFARLFG